MKPAHTPRTAAPQQQPGTITPPHENKGGDVPPVPGEKISPVLQKSGKRITIETDVFRLEIDLKGATLRRAELYDYPVSLDRPDTPLMLLDETESLLYIVQGGLLSNQVAPAQGDMFHADQDIYTLASGQDSLEVPLSWEAGGLRVTKIFGFTRGSHLITVRYVIENGGHEAWKGRSYSQIKRNDPGKTKRQIVRAYTGAVLSSPDNHYEKITFKEMREHKLDQEITGGWSAMLQQYFITALVPDSTKQAHHYYTRVLPDGNYAIGIMSPGVTIAPGATGTIKEQIYVGPKIQKKLRQVADRLDLTVDYGWLWFIAKPLFKGLDGVHTLTGNWGWAIILVTMFLKLMFYPLSAAGYRSMANMRRVQPRILSIRDRYKNDKTRLNQAMMQIYKEEKINPFGGCLPILIQIPVFIALYWVLLGSVEMRQAGFMLWIHDLSRPDPFYILPVLMGITMFIQQKLNPAPLDPVQAKVMMALPVVFTVFFATFPSGLVLYWVVNNTLSIIQQWRITQNLERAGLSQKSH